MPEKMIGQKIIVKDYWSCNSQLCNIHHKSFVTAKRCPMAKIKTQSKKSIVFERIKNTEAFRLKMMGFTYKGIAKEMQLKPYSDANPEQIAESMVNWAIYDIGGCYYHPLYECSKKFRKNEKYNNPLAANLLFIASNSVYWHLKGKEINYV